MLVGEGHPTATVCATGQRCPRPTNQGATDVQRRAWRDRHRAGHATAQVPVPHRFRFDVGHRRHGEPALVAEPAQLARAHGELAGFGPDGSRLRLRRGVQHRRPRRGQVGADGPDDRLAGLVAGRLRALRRSVRAHGVAQRRHLPHRRRPWRWGRRPAALRPVEQLAGQRQPGQGAPPAVADQAEVRRQPVVGRSDHPRRQLRDRVDGAQAVRLRRWPPGRVGGRRHLLGPGGRVARRRALPRRPRAGEPARCGADGPDLRQPAGPERQR